jgi:hypothetical protein
LNIVGTKRRSRLFGEYFLLDFLPEFCMKIDEQNVIIRPARSCLAGVIESAIQLTERHHDFILTLFTQVTERLSLIFMQDSGSKSLDFITEMFMI